MNRDGHKDVVFFVGGEVEKTPAFSKRTLFVVGKQDLDEILKQAKDNRVTHIFMGANHSFEADKTNTTPYWDKTITALLDRSFWVTLDYQAHEHELVLQMLSPGIWQSRLFIPLVGVRIPNIESSSVNLTVKIDDVDFNATNRGVWCMHFHEVTDSNRFTDWQEYESDSIVSVSTNELSNVSVSNVVSKVEPKVRITEEVSREETSQLNNADLGLDTVPTTALKPTDDVEISMSDIVKTPEDAAEAYAEGATTDPLNESPAKKPKGKKV